MPQYYVYLISSLPMLQLGGNPPLTAEEFLTLCRGMIPRPDFAVIMEVVQKDFPVRDYGQATLRKWLEFDRGLRNELVKLRAARLRIDPARFMRAETPDEAYQAHIAVGAVKNPSLLDAELALEQERWRYLEELGGGHYFDIDALIIYGLKLKTLLRWQKIRSADKQHYLAEAVKA